MSHRGTLKAAGTGAFLALLMAIGSTARGQGYTTNFNPTDGFVQNSLSGQNGWDTNDVDNGVTTSSGQAIGQSDYVGVIGNYSTSGSDYYAYLGGLSLSTVVPGTSPVYLYRPFSVAGAATYAFNVDFSLSTSTTYPGRDSFAWTFQNAAGTSLFSVKFQPPTGGSTTTDSVYTTVGLAAATPTFSGVLLNSIYHLTVAVNATLHTATISLTPTGGTTMQIAVLPIATVDPTTVTDVAATWIVASSTKDNGGLTGAGGNALLFDNYAVTVPEPSTWVMLGLGAAGMFVRFRRRVRA